MSYLNDFRKRMNYSDAIIDSTKEQILEDFDNMPTFHNVLINQSVQGVQIISDKFNQKTMISKPDETFNIGDIVEWKDRKWLCVKTDIDDTMYTKGSLLLCNNTITVNNNTYPVVIENYISRNQEVEYRRFTVLSDDTRYLYIPYNDDTKNIKHLDRFVFNDEAYKINVLDKISDVIDGNGVIHALVRNVGLTAEEKPKDGNVEEEKGNWW